MSDNFLTKQYVDHFLQAQIVQQLAVSEKPLRFSELKDDGVENSLFMYHANKLIDRGLVAKQEDGFQLTEKGARWANYANANLLNREALPKPLVQCIIKSKGSVLIANRTGSMKELLNEYMLPGGLHHVGKSSEENMNLFLQGLFAESVDAPSLITVAEVIITHNDEFVHHTISHIFSLELPSQHVPKNTDKFEYNWVDIDSVKTTNPDFSNSQIVPMVVENQSSLKPYEVFRI
jgi:hypothetical protein